MAAKTQVVTVQKPGLDFPNVGFFDRLAAQGAVAIRAGCSVVDRDEPNHGGPPARFLHAGADAELALVHPDERFVEAQLVGEDGGVDAAGLPKIGVALFGAICGPRLPKFRGSHAGFFRDHGVLRSCTAPRSAWRRCERGLPIEIVSSGWDVLADNENAVAQRETLAGIVVDGSVEGRMADGYAERCRHYPADMLVVAIPHFDSEGQVGRDVVEVRIS